MLTSIFDWHKPLWHQLLSEPEKLPHAMLFAGPEGVGKLAFAQALAARLLCEQKAEGNMPCGKCSSCIWLASGNHPDFRLVQPEEGDEAGNGEEAEEPTRAAAATRKPGQAHIRVDQIRALEDFVFVGSHRHGSRVALVAPAEMMNPNAANALLKILEEPPAGVYFILVSSHWRRLLPTVLSRCRSISFSRPDPLLAERWLLGQGVKSATELLQLSGGAPLVAADWAEQDRLDAYRKAIAVLAEKSSDPVAMAAKWSSLVKGEQGLALSQLVETVQKWVFDLVMVKLAGRCRYHESSLGMLEGLAAKVSSVGLLACYNDLLRIRAVVTHPLNTQLFLEDMAARYLRAIVPQRAQVPQSQIRALTMGKT